jgi:hypothetical protein
LKSKTRAPASEFLAVYGVGRYQQWRCPSSPFAAQRQDSEPWIDKAACDFELCFLHRIPEPKDLDPDIVHRDANNAPAAPAQRMIAKRGRTPGGQSADEQHTKPDCDRQKGGQYRGADVERNQKRTDSW